VVGTSASAPPHHFPLASIRPAAVIAYCIRSCVNARMPPKVPNDHRKRDPDRPPRRVLGTPPPVGGTVRATGRHGRPVRPPRDSRPRARPHPARTRSPHVVRSQHRAGDAVLLEQHGLVERETHPTDARARTVALTSEGKRTFRQLWAAGKPVRRQILGALRPGEVETLVRLLARVAEALNAGSVPVGESTTSHSQEDEP
jgi:hypothetical protein